ncbi:MAG TPA: peptide chain release factor N(5)-glutamine methyltransferase [Mycobacteriales bacterium]|nr:peptide chain release factor N(5)-glutamine methyltransferase [Mycobacteriales bacterium]
MNLVEALRWGTATLEAAGVASPAHDARALALHVLGLHKPHELVRVEEFPGEAYTALVEQRAARVPLQHLLGSVGFRWIELQVGPGVFVPRPETEVVVGYAIDALPKDAAPVVVDLCTGSGAIALSVAHEVPGAVVHAVELDPAALEWARRNDPRGTVTWHLGPVEGCLPDLDGAVDVVISNPPYVAETERHLPDPEVIDHDPHLALFAGEDGLDVVREVERAARRLLRPGGLLVVEHSDRQGESAPAVLEQAGGWAEVQDHQDLTGRDRYVTARWQG